MDDVEHSPDNAAMLVATRYSFEEASSVRLLCGEPPKPKKKD